MTVLQQQWAMPSAPRPIVIVGTGGIVADAHLPAYRKAGFEVAGLFDLDQDRARALAAQWDLPHVFASIEEAAGADAVFDVAAPPVAHRAILEALPKGAAVLLQKPMGLELAEATAIRDAANARGLTASVDCRRDPPRSAGRTGRGRGAHQPGHALASVSASQAQSAGRDRQPLDPLSRCDPRLGR